MSDPKALEISPTELLRLRPTWYEIDLDAVASNYREIRRLVGPDVRIYPALKRNGYGCGAGPVARVVAEEGADGLAVANVRDAAAIRREGVSLPILLYASSPQEAAADVGRYGLTPSLSTLEEAESYACAARGGPRLDVFVKVDAGAFRAGVMPRQALPLLRAVSAMQTLRLAGLYAHLYLPDPLRDRSYAEWQFSQVREVLDAATRAGIDIPLRMLASTPVLLQFPDMYLNAVDPGRILYGIEYPPGAARVTALRPALRALKTRLILVKRLLIEDAGGFASPFQIRPGMIVGLAPCGWGDGFPRHVPAGACALVQGRRVPILGPVNLEHLRIDVTDVPGVRAGDEVVLIGTQAEERITPDEVAEAWAGGLTELYCSLKDHIPRVYYRHGTSTVASS
jgi:alanine racemase